MSYSVLRTVKKAAEVFVPVKQFQVCFNQISRTLSTEQTVSSPCKQIPALVESPADDLLAKSSPCSFKQDSKQRLEQSKQVIDKYEILLKTEAAYFNSLRTTLRNYIYIAHHDAIELMINNLSEDLKNESAIIVELNPGIGILTKSLLEAGVTNLRVIEKHNIFHPYLEALFRQYQNKLDIVKKGFQFALPCYEDRNWNVLEDIKPREWADVPPVKIVGTLKKNEVYFLHKMIYSLVPKESVYKVGRIEYFLFISGKERVYMFAQPKGNYHKYRPITVLYNLFFDVKLLGKVRKDYFFTLSRKKNITRNPYYDDKHLYLLKMTPKKELFTSDMTVEKIAELIYFVKLNFYARTANVIPTLEKHILNCGYHFVKYGLNVFTQFGDLSPKETLDVFNIFSSLPEYEQSFFKQHSLRYYDEFYDHRKYIKRYTVRMGTKENFGTEEDGVTTDSEDEYDNS